MFIKFQNRLYSVVTCLVLQSKVWYFINSQQKYVFECVLVSVVYNAAQFKTRLWRHRGVFPNEQTTQPFASVRFEIWSPMKRNKDKLTKNLNSSQNVLMDRVFDCENWWKFDRFTAYFIEMIVLFRQVPAAVTQACVDMSIGYIIVNNVMMLSDPFILLDLPLTYSWLRLKVSQKKHEDKGTAQVPWAGFIKVAQWRKLNRGAQCQ